VGAYDFGYLLSGDAPAKPVQVFDDGRNTYFQFRSGQAAPAIFSARAGTPQLVVATQEGPYVRVAEVHGRFVLQVGRAQAHVIHAAADRPDAPPITSVAANGMAQPYTGTGGPPAGGRLVASLSPVAMTTTGLAETAGMVGKAERPQESALDRNSYATPVKGDIVYWPEHTQAVEHSIGFAQGAYVLSRDAQRTVARIAQRAGSAARFTVIGRDYYCYRVGLDGGRAEALRNALLRSGISSDRITVRTGVGKSGQQGKLWDSTLLVQTPQQPPLLRPAQAATQSAALLTRVQAVQQLSQLSAQQPSPAFAPPEESPRGGFTLSVADKTVSEAVRRWAQALNYQVVWDAAAQMDAPIAGEATLQGQNLAEALDVLVRGLRDKGYALEVTIYANRVIRFTSPGAEASQKTTTPGPQAVEPAKAPTTATRQMLPDASDEPNDRKNVGVQERSRAGRGATRPGMVSSEDQRSSPAVQSPSSRTSRPQLHSSCSRARPPAIGCTSPPELTTPS
jgi:outer membrane protein OmpA-like peptidoglycan-associated protein